MKINWKVRFKNPTWLVTAFIPHLLIITQLVLTFVNQYIYPTGYSLTKQGIDGVMGVVNAIALVLGIGGQIIDPTTKGIGDSIQNLALSAPKAQDVATPDAATTTTDQASK